MFDIHKTSAAAYLVAVDGDDFRYADSNAACHALTGMTERCQPGLAPGDVFPPTVAEDVLARYRACVGSRQALSYVAEVGTADGARSWQTTLFPMLDEHGRVSSIVGICSAAPDRAASDNGTLSLNEKASLALETIDGGFWVYEVAEMSFETSRPLAELIAGPGATTLNLAEYLSHVHSEDLSVAGVGGAGQDRSVVEYRVFTFDGRMLWLKSRRRVIRNAAGMPVRVVGLVADITSQKLAFQTLEAAAATDPLTSVGNRRFFDGEASRSFHEAKTSGKPIGVLMIDLDDFKLVNDRHGHRAGDELLRKVAKRIARHVRKSDIVARIGGDEFVILLRGSSSATGEALAARIRQSFIKPFDLAKQAVFVGISTGVGIASPADPSIETVIQRADESLYRMKQQRRLLIA